jgi:gliding motility-associated-like protein
MEYHYARIVMRIPKLLLLFAVLLSSICSFGQKEWSNWYFNPRTLFSFSNNNLPQVKTDFINPIPSYWYSYYYNNYSGASYSDPLTGETRFVLAGRFAYDKNYDMIPSSLNLRVCPGDKYSFHIIPFQNNPNKFYIIQFQDMFADILAAETGLQVRCPNAIGLGYSVLDLSLNNGLGEFASMNTVVRGGLPGGITLIRHANGKDTWVVVHGWNNNEFYSYLFTDNGVSAPVTSAIGPVISRSNPSVGGTLSASHNGKIIAAQITGTGVMDLYDFDNATGRLTGFKSLNTTYAGDRMVFSPDDTKLYYLGHYYAPGVYQFDLDVPDAQGSLTKIGEDPTKMMYDMQLGPDGKIYITGRQENLDNNTQFILPVINCPNLAKYACNYDADGFKLPVNYSYSQFPNLINDYIKQPKAARATEFSLGNDTAICFGSHKLSAPAGWQYYRWNTGETTREITVTTPGTYYVLAGDMGFSCPTAFGSIRLKNAARPLNLGRDTVLCPGIPYTIQISSDFNNLLWNDGTTDQNKVITSGKTYSLVARDLNGCTNWDTVSVGYKYYPKADFGKDTTLCENQTLLLQLEPIPLWVTPSPLYQWQNGSSKDTFRVKQSGTYWGRVTYQGCTTSDTIRVAYVSAKGISLGADTSLCSGDTLNLEMPVPGAQILWSTGETGQRITVRNSGNYWVRVNNGSCTVTDTIKVSFQPKPLIFLGNDTTLCEGVRHTLSASLTNASFLWQDGSTATSLIVNAPGVYWVRATVLGCSNSDSIAVSYKPLPSVHLGNDTSICKGQALLLNPYDPSIQSYLWGDGSTLSGYLVSKAGSYRLQVTGTNGCLKADTIQVSEVGLPGFSLGSDTVLCEREILHLNFNLANARYQWSTGSTTNDFTITGPGLYWLEITQNGCGKKDSLVVGYKPLPALELGRDTTLCEGVSKLLDATYPGATYLWQDRSTSPAYSINKPGTFHVTVNLDGCIKKDTITVAYRSKPRFSLGNDTSVCIGQELRLDPRISNASLRWQDGSAASYFTVKNPGLYEVTATNECGSASDQIVIALGICKLYMPNAFTPNNDGLNEVFRVKDPSFIQAFSMVIYNRWGEVVFKTDDPHKGWDGKYKGLQQPEGNYIWQISLTTKDGEKVSAYGSVVLIR